MTLPEGLVLGDPAFLWLLLPLAALAAFRLSRPRPTLDGGSRRLASGLPDTWRTRSAWLPGALACVAGVLLVLALARPLKGREEARVLTSGLDIMLALDASSSMSQAGLQPGVAKVEVVKAAAAEFVKARPDDRLGLVTFAAFPRTECPLTLDHEALLARLAAVRTVTPNSDEDGTAIGVALGQAARKLRESDAKSRVVVLLTDGRNTLADIDPLAAAELCRGDGVRVHTIFVSQRVSVLGRLQPQVSPEAVELLASIARTTGGRFFRADDAHALREVYAEIDQLEKTPRQDVRYTDYEDLYPWLLVPAGALLLLELLLRRGPLLEFAA